MEVKFVQEERVVRAFMIHECNNEKLVKSRGRAVDELMRLSGEIVFEIQVKEENLLIVVAFREEAILQSWKALVSPVVLNPVDNCQVLSITDDNDINVSAESSEKMQKMVREYHGVVLKVKCWDTSKNEYRILVYFTKKQDMEEWKKQLPV